MIVVGIDQSYQDTGVAIAMDGKIKNVTHLDMSHTKSNTAKRNMLRDLLHTVLALASKRARDNDTDVIVVFERIRLKSAGKLSMNYIKAMGAMCAVIVDAADGFNIPCYSADTRAWKAAVVGTSKPQENNWGVDPNKWPTIQWCRKNGYDKFIKDYDVGSRKTKGVLEDTRGRFIYNDNKADAIGIALYGCMADAKLKEEKR